MKEVLKEDMKVWKRERKRWEKEWWEDFLNQCERAAVRGDQGTLYKLLTQLGKKGVKMVASRTISQRCSRSVLRIRRRRSNWRWKKRWT